jgi:proteasome lid subunit RPN8/RPN11
VGRGDIPALKQLIVTKSQLEIMRVHVQSCAPLEACGLLAGKDGKVDKVFTITNEAQSPVRFRMNPAEQLRAFDWMDVNGLELVGIFHSHPAGPETASPTDIAEAAYQVVQIIWSRSGRQTKDGEETWMARAFWIENGKSSNAKLQITDSE